MQTTRNVLRDIGYKTSLSENMNVEISNVFFSHSGLKLENKY